MNQVHLGIPLEGDGALFFLARESLGVLEHVTGVDCEFLEGNYRGKKWEGRSFLESSSITDSVYFTQAEIVG